MSRDIVPVWALSAAEAAGIPSIPDTGGLTRERLNELRTAMAAFSNAPLITLEAYPLTSPVETKGAMALSAVSPLAQQLKELISAAPKNTKQVAAVADSGEVLYRMVVPAKAVAQVGEGVLKPMKSKAVAGGIYSSLVDSGSSIRSSAAFVPVSKTTSAAAAGGTAVGATAAGAAVTVAAPLILMALAVAASAHAEAKRQESLEKIENLLEKLNQDELNKRRDQLAGCRGAIDSATALLLDGAAVGSLQGIDSAANVVDTAMESAVRVATGWLKKLEELSAQGSVDVAQLQKAFPGLLEKVGPFTAELELANLAIALKRRLIVLQAVEAAQKHPDHLFENFAAKLNHDQRRVDEVEQQLVTLLRGLAGLRVTPPKGLRSTVLPRKHVDTMVSTIYKLQALGSTVPDSGGPDDVVVEIVQRANGSLHVLPPIAN